MEISRIVFFCPDKKVGEVLRILAGIALQTPEVTPVTNAKVKRNGLVEDVRGGEAIDLFRKWIQERKLSEVNAPLGKEFCRTIGRAEGGYNNLFLAARKHGLLRKTGKGMKTVWKVQK
jgi:hypothetical protein